MANETKVSAEQVMEALQPVEDPEIHLSVVDLGLIYDVQIDDENPETLPGKTGA